MAPQKTFHLTIARVDGPLFEGDVSSVTVPGVEGEMTLLAEHSAIVSPLKAGVVTVRAEGGEQFFEVEESGTLEVSGNQATVLM